MAGWTLHRRADCRVLPLISQPARPDFDIIAIAWRNRAAALKSGSHPPRVARASLSMNDRHIVTASPRHLRYKICCRRPRSRERAFADLFPGIKPLCEFFRVETYLSQRFGAPAPTLVADRSDARRRASPRPRPAPPRLRDVSQMETWLFLSHTGKSPISSQ